MRGQLCWAVGAGLAAMVAVGGLAIAAEQAVVVRAGNMVLTLNGGVTPKALPRSERVPMGFHASGSFATVDGTHPPALEEAVFDSDKSSAPARRSLAAWYAPARSRAEVGRGVRTYPAGGLN